VDRSNGLITSLVGSDGSERLASSVRPNFWRPPTDNDVGWGAPGLLSKWRLAGVPESAGGTLKVISCVVERGIFGSGAGSDVDSSGGGSGGNGGASAELGGSVEVVVTFRVLDDGTGLTAR